MLHIQNRNLRRCDQDLPRSFCQKRSAEGSQDTLSLPISPTSKIDEMKSETRLEKEVEFAASTFMCLIVDAFKSTEAGITDVEALELNFWPKMG